MRKTALFALAAMGSPAVVAVHALLLAGCTNAGGNDGDMACKFSQRVREVDSFGGMPMPIRDYLEPKFDFGDPHTGGIAPRGGKWNATDVVTRDAPSRRFMRAGYAGDKWFLRWERGGIAYWRLFAVFALQGGNVIVMAHGNLPSDNPCSATEAAMDGRLPTGGELPW